MSKVMQQDLNRPGVFFLNIKPICFMGILCFVFSASPAFTFSGSDIDDANELGVASELSPQKSSAPMRGYQALPFGSLGNTAHVSQTGNSNSLSVAQTGRKNVAELNQAGSHNQLNLVQTGNRNTLKSTQYNNNNILSVTQTGNNNYLEKNQYGNDAVSITQVNGGNAVITTH